MTTPSEHKTVQGRILAYAQFFDTAGNRELDLQLIDYGDLSRPTAQWRNMYGVTEEFTVHNGYHAGGRRFPDQRHPGAGDRVQERDQRRSDRARGGPDTPLPRWDAGGDGTRDAVHRHRSHRLRLRGDLEHGAPEHIQLEARGSGQPQGQG